MTRTFFVPAALALAVTLPAAPAQALVARTFLSAAGSDSNNCANVATPCRHLATAYAATAADGEIYVLDPANYGSLTIAHGVSIEGHGWASIAPVSGQPAITIQANPGDKINIIGVVLDGTAILNTNGIDFNSGGTLTVRDSVIRNFTSYGINFEPNASTSSQIFVSNTLVSDNNFGGGIRIAPRGSGTTNGVLDHVQMENNESGLVVDNEETQTINISVTDSVSANNAGDGISCHSGGMPTNIMVRNSTIANNGLIAGGGGMTAEGIGASIRATRSTITGNAYGWNDDTGGAVTSYADNNIEDNRSINFAPTQIGYK